MQIMTSKNYRLRLSKWKWRSAPSKLLIKRPQRRMNHLKMRKVPQSTPPHRYPMLRLWLIRRCLSCIRCQCKCHHHPKLVILTQLLSGTNSWWINKSNSNRFSKFFSSSKSSSKIRLCQTSPTWAELCHHQWEAPLIGQVLSLLIWRLNSRKKRKKLNGMKMPYRNDLTRWRSLRPSLTSWISSAPSSRQNLRKLSMLSR